MQTTASLQEPKPSRRGDSEFMVHDLCQCLSCYSNYQKLIPNQNPPVPLYKNWGLGDFQGTSCSEFEVISFDKHYTRRTLVTLQESVD